MSSIKIFLPSNTSGKFLYGLKKSEIIEDKGEALKTIVSYYVIVSSNQKLLSETLELLGSFGETSEDAEINLITDSHSRVNEVKVNGSRLPASQRVLLFYYDKPKLERSYIEQFNPEANDNHFSIIIAKVLQKEQEKATEKSLACQVSTKSRSFLVGFAHVSSKALQLMSPAFRNTAISRHCRSWQKCLNDDHYKNGFLILDVLLGIIFFLLMNHVQNPGRYFMSLAEFIVMKLRKLLEMLEGSPVGLKLNVQLNNFLLSCFMYHVDLWWNFILIVEPAIHYLFLPITMFGLMGFSFQCAMICDVITLITLHAHCFYIYAAMLYKLELTSIRSLLRIVVGRRLNVLKNRVESQNYTNRQLFLATLFFTTLLFLVPTILIYYCVFASLRLFIYCLSYVLMIIQHKILTFPFYKYLLWITGSYVDPTNISMHFISRRELHNAELLTFEIELHSRLPWSKSMFVAEGCETQLPKPLSIEAFAKFLLKGEMMTFLQNI